MSSAIAKTLLSTLVAALVAVSCGCAPRNSPTKAVEDEGLYQKMDALSKNGEIALLRDLTGGDWDRVHISMDPVSKAYLSHAVGTDIDIDDYFTGSVNVFIFMKERAVQRVVYTHPGRLHADKFYANTVRLEGHKGDYPLYIRE